MINRFPYGVLAAGWLAVAAIGWLVAVPHWLSSTNLGWVAALGLTLSATLLGVQRAGSPSRSMAGLLYDADRRTAPGR